MRFALLRNMDTLKVFSAILESGFDPNFTIGSSRAPLHNAANEGHAAIVALLLEYGADVDLRRQQKVKRL
jgi:ankyrin repeat protein